MGEKHQDESLTLTQHWDEVRPTTVGLPDGLKLSVPYNFDRGLLDVLSEVSDHVSSIYLPFHPSVSISARPYNGPERLADYVAELEAVAERLADIGLGMSLVANAPSTRVDVTALVDTAARVAERLPALRVTFADLLVAVAARERADWLTIGTSCLAMVDSQTRALWWVEQANAAHIVVARDINRRPERLAGIADLGVTVGVVDSDDCVPGCACLQRHFLPLVGDGGGDFLDMDPACDPHNVEVRRKRPWLLAQKELLPGHFRHLVPVVSEVKITGRNLPSKEILRLLALGLEARSLVHPRRYYEEPEEAWETIARCDRRCTRCGWCERHIHPPVKKEDGEDEAREEAPKKAVPASVLAARRLLGTLAHDAAAPLEGYEPGYVALETSGDGAPEMKLELQRGDERLALYLRRRADIERPLLAEGGLALLHGGEGPLEGAERRVAERVLRAFARELPTVME